MAELKLKIPSEVKEEIDKHSDIEWSSASIQGVFRKK
jgi:hypothetical protein